MKARARWGAVVLGFAWMAFVYASFYLVQQQRPFDSVRIQQAWGNLRNLGLADLRAIGSTLLDILVAGATMLVGAGLGLRLCRWLGLRLERVGERWVLGSGVGLGAISLMVLGVGLLGGLRPWVMALLFGVMLLVSLPDLMALVRAFIGARMAVRPAWGLRLYLLLTVVLSLLVALSPPIDWDGLFYHLTMPQRYIAQGRIRPVTDVPHQFFPGFMEMLYLAAMLVKGDVAAKLLHFGYMILLGGVIYLLADRHLGPRYGWLSVLVYAAIPMVPVLGSWAYNDLALVFYQMAALYALFNWFRDKVSSWLILTGVFCGLAMGTKYTSFVCPLTVVLLMAWHLARQRSTWGTWLRALSLYGSTALAVAAPWYVRNLAFTGNPVYPFAYGLFGGRGWDAWRTAWYARGGSGVGWNLGALLKLPWTLTLGIRDMNFYDGRTGPFFLLFLPLVIAWGARLYGRSRARPPAMGYLLMFAAIQYGFWTMGVVSSRSLFQSRLLLPALVALCAPLSYLFDELRVLDTRLLSLRRLVGISVVLVLAANLCYQFLDVLRIHPLPVLVGGESREAFLTRNLGAHYAAMKLVNERVKVDEQVLFMWEPRSYYCQRDVQPDPILERWAWLRYQHGDDLEAIARDLQKRGYTHLLLHQDGLEFMRQSRLDPLNETDFDAWDTFTQTYLRQEAGVGTAFLLYRVMDERTGE
jgi:hypothetical protein